MESGERRNALKQESYGCNEVRCLGWKRRSLGAGEALHEVAAADTTASCPLGAHCWPSRRPTNSGPAVGSLTPSPDLQWRWSLLVRLLCCRQKASRPRPKHPGPLPECF